MQTKLSNLVRQPNRSFASALLAFSLFRFLHPHHANSANARYLCESGESDPTARLAMESPAERYASNERPEAITPIWHDIRR